MLSQSFDGSSPGAHCVVFLNLPNRPAFVVVQGHESLKLPRRFGLTLRHMMGVSFVFTWSPRTTSYHCEQSLNISPFLDSPR